MRIWGEEEMKKYINIIIIVTISLYIYTLPKLVYEYPKNPIVADSLMEECFNKIVDIVNQALEGKKSRELSYEWIGTTMEIEDAINCASKPLSDEQITILFDLIEEMRLHNLQYDQFKSHIFAPHMKRWGYDSRMEAIILEDINTSNPLDIAYLIDSMNKVGLINQQIRKRCIDIISFKDITTKTREPIDNYCGVSGYNPDASYNDNALFAAMDYLSNVYPDDREVIEAMADGILPADSLGYTVRWHLRYFMDDPYIREHRKVNKDIAADILKEKYENAKSERESMIYHYAMMSTHKYISEELYNKGVEDFFNTDIPVLREFLFREIQHYFKNSLIDKKIAEETVKRIHDRLDSLKEDFGLKKNEKLPDILIKPSEELRQKYKLIKEYAYYNRLAYLMCRDMK